MTGSTELDIATLDFSAFGPQDQLNIVLQRSAVLGKGDGKQASVRKWRKGDSGPLEQAVAEQGDAFVRSAATMIQEEFESMRGLLDRLPHARIADIGCGYALFDLFAYHALGCDLLLIDIEETEERHFGFEKTGAGYSSLPTARQFLVDNGVPESRIITWNPQREEIPAGAPVDIAVSFLSCGFHYPVDMYLPFFDTALRPDGAVILDLRGSQADRISEQLEALGSIRVLRATAGVRRVLLKKRVPE